MKRHRFVLGHFGKQAFHKLIDGSHARLQYYKINKYTPWVYPVYIYRLKSVHSDLFKELWL